MSQSFADKASDQIAHTVQETSRIAAAVADAVEDGVCTAKRAAKQGCEAAEEFVNHSTRRIQRNPLLSVAVTLVAGFALGTLASRMSRQR